MGSYSLVLSCVVVAVVAVVVVVFPSIIYCKSPAALSPQRGKLLVAAACEILIALHRGAVCPSVEGEYSTILTYDV